MATNVSYAQQCMHVDTVGAIILCKLCSKLRAVGVAGTYTSSSCMLMTSLTGGLRVSQTAALLSPSLLCTFIQQYTTSG
jgi:hypothetical protein